MKIFVGNLAPEVTEPALAELFGQFGRVESAQLERVIFTDAPRGFGFVEMPFKRHSLAAIAALNGKEFVGRRLKVNEARIKVQPRRRRRRGV
ncbi:MAG: RNA-binding protein [Gammaproteobacteria bacterium]|nr:RNA-binding protein [Gammaproteobacteria bacterium]